MDSKGGKKDKGATPKHHGTATSKSRESLDEFKKRMRETKKDEVKRADFLQDEYEKSMNSGNYVRKATGITYHDDMVKHKCEYDDFYPENPQRYTAVMDRIKELGLVERCTFVEVSEFETAEILKVHAVHQLVSLKRVCQDYADLDKLESHAKKYDAIYFNEHTYNCAMLACNATLSLLRAVAVGDVQNGMAVVRPPGHHAQFNKFNGYCFLNNVAIGAQFLKTSQKMKKILIVDFDVHHGQGTQQAFYNDDSVLYFSIHRYEHGAFWPSLRESNFDFIGDGKGAGYNINFPLNTTGLDDSDYIAIVTQILLPVAYEFSPDFILVSAGYDSAIGDEKGKMNVSPAFYGHLIKLLSGLADGKLAVILEGGYFLPSLAEGVAMTLRALLDDAPGILPPLKAPHASVINTINDVKFVLYKRWACFRILKIHYLVGGKTCSDEGVELHNVEVTYVGDDLVPPFETRYCYPLHPADKMAEFQEIVNKMKAEYGKPIPNKVCYAYHDDMLLHVSTGSNDPVENPNRLQVVYKRFLELSLNSRCVLVFNNEDIRDEVNVAKQVHLPMYIDKLMKTEFSPKLKSNDMYWNKDYSRISIKTAIGCILSVVDSVMGGEFTSGVALIRPPGHHAETNRCLGFCYINNVAVAATHLLLKHKLNRIMIIDFDIHHGNGTQKIFYDTDKVLYLSIHKYEQGLYFPSNTDGASTCVGKGDGKGYNINIPFNMERMSQIDYLYTFFRVVLPIAYSYAPECILVSAGFDAGINDLLGNYKILPEGFGHLIQLLKPLSGGRLVLAMEGGYNLNTLKHSMCFCVKTLLGDPLPKLNITDGPKGQCVKAIEQVINIHKKHWPILDVDKPLPNKISALVIHDKRRDLNPEPDKNEMITCDIARLLQSATIFHD